MFINIFYKSIMTGWQNISFTNLRGKVPASAETIPREIQLRCQQPYHNHTNTSADFSNSNVGSSQMRGGRKKEEKKKEKKQTNPYVA